MNKMFEKEPELVFLSFMGALCVVVGVLAGYGVAALTRCPRDDRANARPDVDGKRTISPDASRWSERQEKPA